VYERGGKLVEKYVVDGSATGGGGGEYPLQDGFGWSNGVTLALLDRLCAPERACDSAQDVEAAECRPKRREPGKPGSLSCR